MDLVDALIAVAQSDVPDKWARYYEIAPHIWSVLADAPRELLGPGAAKEGVMTLTQRSGPEAEEAHALEDVFLERFAAARRAQLSGLEDLEATWTSPQR